MLDLIDVQSLAVADFDGDGFRDLAIGRKDDVLVLFGDGTGAFPRMADLPESNSNYFGAAAGDLDGDEIADLVVSQANNDAVLVYRSSSGGEFADPLTFATGDNPQRLALVRLDRDSTLDLVVSVMADDSVEVLLGDGAGGFGEPTAFASGGGQPFELALGAFNPDSMADLVVGNLNDKSLAVLLGAPAGQLELAQVYPLPGKPRSTAVADFDLDGHLDVAAALEDLDRVQVLYGDGLGGLLDDGVELLVGDRPVGAVTADFNLDDAPDLLVINRDDASVGLSFGAPELPGQFMAPVLMDPLNGFSSMSVVISADLNHDGVADVIIGGAGVRAMISNP
ncbi:MAG: VCBS repeat-containing protein [Enhygromyxa sp.]